jgi:hypothetical protein
MRKIGIIAVLSLMALAFAAVPALAAKEGNPHFIKNATSATLSGSNLVVNFKETGLPSGQTENVQVTATEMITYECVNGGGLNPSASNKKTFRTTGSASGFFPADQNGNIEGQLTITPRSAASLGFSCPPGQTTTLVSVVYSNVLVTDLTSGASIGIPGTFTYTNPLAPPVR